MFPSYNSEHLSSGQRLRYQNQGSWTDWLSRRWVQAILACIVLLLLWSAHAEVMRSKDGEMARLLHRLSETQARLTSMQSELQQHQQQAATLEEQTLAFDRRVEEFKATQAQFEQRLVICENNVEEAREKESQAQLKAQNLESELSSVRRLHQQCTAELLRMKAQIPVPTPTPTQAPLTQRLQTSESQLKPSSPSSPPSVKSEQQSDVISEEQNQPNSAQEESPSSSSSSSSLSEAEQRIAEYRRDSSPAARAEAIKQEFVHAWKAYVEHAFGRDELRPLSRTGHDSFSHMGLTLIDSLDTIIIMQLSQEQQRCREWIAQHLQFGDQEDINLFETTIRVLGGLLAAHGLTNDQLYVDKAEELARQMMFAFDSPTGLPYGTLGLKSHRKYNPSWAGGASTVAEVGSIQMEWQYLSRVTGDPVFASKVDKITDRLQALNTALWPQFISVDNGHLTSSTITFGARVDSIYEYFLKQHLLSNKQLPNALQLYKQSMAAMATELLSKSVPNELSFISEKHGSKLVGKMDHLVCFMPGLLALGANSSVLDSATSAEHLFYAKELMKTCYEMYRRSPTGLAPEIVHFAAELEDFEIDPRAAHSLLRPETVESLFVMWRVTKDETYRRWGWEIFEAFVRYSRVPGGGYASLRDVRRSDINDASAKNGEGHWVNWNDKMESFFLAETMKYLYLLFSPDDVIPLDKYVFNTEAHPLPVAR